MTVSFQLDQDVLNVKGPLERFHLGAKHLYRFPRHQGKLRIDLRGVTNLDTAGLAWLLKVIAYYQKKQCDVSVIQVPNQLIALAEISNVLELLPIEQK